MCMRHAHLPLSSPVCDTCEVCAVCVFCVRRQAALKALDNIDPTALMNELAELAQTMEAVDLSRRTGMPCDPYTWPSELIRNEALMSTPAWAEEPGLEESTGAEGDRSCGEYEQVPRTAHLFSLEAALEASAAKQAQRSQNKRKKKGKK